MHGGSGADLDGVRRGVVDSVKDLFEDLRDIEALRKELEPCNYDMIRSGLSVSL